MSEMKLKCGREAPWAALQFPSGGLLECLPLFFMLPFLTFPPTPKMYYCRILWLFLSFCRKESEGSNVCVILVQTAVKFLISKETASFCNSESKIT